LVTKRKKKAQKVGSQKMVCFTVVLKYVSRNTNWNWHKLGRGLPIEKNCSGLWYLILRAVIRINYPNVIFVDIR
jgi:hypothetical protein